MIISFEKKYQENKDASPRILPFALPLEAELHTRSSRGFWLSQRELWNLPLSLFPVFTKKLPWCWLTIAPPIFFPTQSKHVYDISGWNHLILRLLARIFFILFDKLFIFANWILKKNCPNSENRRAGLLFLCLIISFAFFSPSSFLPFFSFKTAEMIIKL